MTPGLPGAGIGGLFYLASSFLLPFRSALRRLRGRPDPVSSRQLTHTVAMAGGVVAGLWVVGWVLAWVVPDEILGAVSVNNGRSLPGRTVIPVATFATAIGTLLLVLLAVEVARLGSVRRQAVTTRRTRSR